MDRAELAELVAFTVPPAPAAELVEAHARDGYSERLLVYESPDDGEVRAYLLVPDRPPPHPGVVAYHQHNSEWHLGKSEMAGRVGDPLNAFGPALARRGIAVLAPDAVGFEDRRRTGRGTEPRPRDGLQHFNELGYRLVQGRLLATTVLRDAAAALSLLADLEHVDAARVGVLGHSYGGSTAIFHAALDERARFACTSGAACTYRRRMADGTAIELAQMVPGILALGDLDAIVALIAPRPLLIVSATDDRYSADADAIERTVASAWEGAGELEHARYAGPHPLTPERFTRIVEWLIARAGA